MQYTPSTIDVIGDMVNGLRVDTSVFNTVSYLYKDGTTVGQFELFNVYGRILVLQLFIEAITTFGAGAARTLFNATWTTPVVAVQPMCSKCDSVAALPRGCRITFVGGIVATAAVITVATPGAVSDVTNIKPHIIGMKSGIGTIGMLTTDANSASGTAQASLFYVPLSDGAYCTRVL
jgi:hypothetical protein